MFHRPSAIGGDASLASRNRSRLMPLQNENSTNIRLKDSSTTTPAKQSSSSRPRRAFGDISNKKGAANTTKVFGNGNNSIQKNNSKESSLPLKPSSSHTPSNKQQVASLIPKVGGSKTRKPLSKRSHPWTTTTSNSTNKLSSASPAPNRQVDFILPSGSKVAPKSQAQPTVHLTPKVKSKVVEPVDDVELPAGRLWVEQLTHDLKHDDDEASVDSLLEHRTMWDDWKESMRKQWKEEQDQNLQEELELHAHLDNLLREQDEKGLESLIDGMDILQLEEELDFGAFLEDDDWSAPASSVDGTLAI